MGEVGNQNEMKYEVDKHRMENCLWKEVQRIRDFGEEWESGYLKGLEKAKE